MYLYSVLRQCLGVAQQISSVYAFQAFHLKTEARDTGRATLKYCL